MILKPVSGNTFLQGSFLKSNCCDFAMSIQWPMRIVYALFQLKKPFSYEKMYKPMAGNHPDVFKF
jgi:hypothetical protein